MVILDDIPGIEDLLAPSREPSARPPSEDEWCLFQGFMDGEASADKTRVTIDRSIVYTLGRLARSNAELSRMLSAMLKAFIIYNKENINKLQTNQTNLLI